MRVALLGLLALLATAVLPAAATAQEPGPAATTITVFLDCPRGCDSDYLRTEIEFVTYVRDRQDADVHLLITREIAAGGGSEFTLAFIGRNQFEGRDNTLQYMSSRDATADERREGLAQVMRLGLLLYVAESPLADRIQVTVGEQEGRPQERRAEPQADPWNAWVFRLRGSGSYRGEERSSNFNTSGSFSANRVTSDWKILTGINGSNRERTFILQDGSAVTSVNRSYGGNALVARSLGGHWSAGTLASINSSTFLNQRLSTRLASAVEYNIFPYAESTRRQFTLLYSLGAHYFDYFEETIFEQTDELLYDHSLILALDVRQPWGSADASAELSHYLHDASLHRMDVSGGVDIRVFRGLSVNLSANASRIRDQLYLARGDATDEEILTSQRQLGTGYRYGVSAGFSYSFGSTFRPVVNPRFTGESRRF